MRKIKLFALICLGSSFVSCEDAPIRVCALCTEQNTGTVAADYCGSAFNVDAYIETLENTAGQNWQCVKH